MATLYTLTAEYLELIDMMENPELDREIIMDTLEGLDGELEDKAEGYAIVMKELESDMAKFKDEIKRLSGIVTSIQLNIDRMKRDLLISMQATGKTKFKTNLFSFGVAKNGGKAPLIYTEGVAVPLEWQVPTYKPDNEAIRKALEAGEELPFASIGERGVHLNIR